jgi:16S rRNA (guanine966-N2)-methyltransferase
VRVIAGWLGGQTFASPNGHRTHPMSDKVRGALFNSLGDISGLNVLDAFAGSGAISIEAISRGAQYAVAIDNDRNAQAAIADNLQKLSLGDRIKLVKANASSWLNTTDDVFNIVICDPPYDLVQTELIQDLAARARVGGIIIISLPPKVELTLSTDYKQLSYKSYGDAELYFYRRQN